jgi:hypothetical protein
VAYTPDWEPLADALKRVIAAGTSEGEGKIDLCRAVADRKIAIRVRIAANDYMKGKVFKRRNIGVPPHLNPDDFDWTHSQPLNPWPIGPAPEQAYSWFEDWKPRPLDLIELWTADVIEVLCGTQSGTVSLATAGVETAATKALATHLKSNPQLSRADAAEWCKTSGYSLSDRGFQNRVWPEARVHAGLPKKGPPGRKRESTR